MDRALARDRCRPPLQKRPAQRASPLLEQVSAVLAPAPARELESESELAAPVLALVPGLASEQQELAAVALELGPEQEWAPLPPEEDATRLLPAQALVLLRERESVSASQLAPEQEAEELLPERVSAPEPQLARAAERARE